MFQSWSSRISTPTQAGAQQHGSWALFANSRIELLRRAAAAAFLGDFEHLHRGRPLAQASQPLQLHKSPSIGLGDFREAHQGVLGGVFRMISRSSSAFSNCSTTRDGDEWFRSYSSSATTQIEGDICTQRRLRVISAYAYIHIDTQSTYHRAVGPGLVGQPVGCPVWGSPHTGSGALSSSSKTRSQS